MFKFLGKLHYQEEKEIIKINSKDIKEGVNYIDDYIFYNSKKDIKIYDRICDHAGGKLISKNGESICPMHNWKFDPTSGYYTNGIKKKETNFVKKKNLIEIIKVKLKPKIKKYSNKDNKTIIRFFNHAFLKVSSDKFSFSVDPWAIGPAFNTGWWLKHKTKNDWIENLNNSKFIYISHNHPDHLHPLTLSKIKKTIPIIVPNFTSDSTGKYMEELGFKNIFRLNFNTQYNLEGTELILSILKSGDFREDSGLYFSNGNFTALFGVDSNMLNFERYPSTLDLYGSSFASGATGYPLMFENYKNDEKIKILKKEKLFTKTKILLNLNKMQPKYFLPYAGFFEEKLKRDSRIKKLNKKNSIDDYLIHCNKKKIKLLNVEKKDLYTFKGNELLSMQNIDKNSASDLDNKEYLSYYKKEYEKIDEEYIENYFLNSGFNDNLILHILLTNDEFKLLNMNYFIDFSKKDLIFKKTEKFHKSIIQKKSSIKHLVLKVRKESFLNTLYNKLPWEDLLIGFQCKVLRNPNLYNANFWYHFTNNYITSKDLRISSKCNSCTSLTHYFDKIIYSKSLQEK